MPLDISDSQFENLTYLYQKYICTLTISGGTPKYSRAMRITYRKSSTKDIGRTFSGTSR